MKVSVIVCCYNEEKHLPICLQSLKKQTYRDFELIVVDDGSTDGTSQVAQDLGAKVVKINHSGLPTARNVGVENASGDIVAFTDADCTVEPKWLEKLVYALESKGYDGVIGGTVKALNPQNSFLKCLRLMDRNSVRKCISGGYNMAYRKETIITLGGFDPRFFRGGDYDFNLRVLENGFKVGWVKDATVYFTFPDSIRKLIRKRLKDGVWFKRILRKHPWYLKKNFRRIMTGIAQILPFLRIRYLINAYRQTSDFKLSLRHFLYSYVSSLVFYIGFLLPLSRENTL